MPWCGGKATESTEMRSEDRSADPRGKFKRKTGISRRRRQTNAERFRKTNSATAHAASPNPYLEFCFVCGVGVSLRQNKIVLLYG